MAAESSILNSVKKNLGLDENYHAFDHDVMTHINTCFFTLNQLGIGPSEGFMIEDENVSWADFTDNRLNIAAQNALQTYFYLKVRSFFDPPGAPHHVTALKDQLVELEHRLLTERELARMAYPPALPFDDEIVLDGGVG